MGGHVEGRLFRRDGMVGLRVALLSRPLTNFNTPFRCRKKHLRVNILGFLDETNFEFDRAKDAAGGRNSRMFTGTLKRA